MIISIISFFVLLGTLIDVCRVLGEGYLKKSSRVVAESIEMVAQENNEAKPDNLRPKPGILIKIMLSSLIGFLY